MSIAEDDFVRFLYTHVLGRSSVDDGEVRPWAAALRDGQASIASVFDEFVGSEEAQHGLECGPAFRAFFEGPVRGTWSDVAELVTAAGTPRLIDVGAMSLEFEQDVWRPLERAGWQVVGFEPQDAEREARAAADPDVVMHPHFVGDGSPAVFHANEIPSTSSLFPPATESIRRLHGLEEGHRVASRHAVETTRLDDIDDTEDAVFCKIDVQGGELAVLRGAERRLRDLLVVQAEVQFNELYEGVPLFGSIDAHLRDRGFELFDVIHQTRYHHADGRSRHPWRARRLMWGDAVYVATPDRLSSAPVDRVVAAAWVVHELYQGYDWASQTLAMLDQRNGTDLAAAHARLLDPPE